MKLLLVATSLLLTALACAEGQEIVISLSGRNLDPGDAIWGEPDPFVNVGYAMGSSSFTKVGKTETLHTKNPTWAKTFQFQFVSALDQRLEFEVIENDAFADDLYGKIYVTMREVLEAPGKILERDIAGKGTLIIRNVA